MVLSGDVPSVMVGKNKRLINVDLLMERLANPDDRTDGGPLPNLGIRRANETPRPGTGHGAGLHG